MQPAPAAVSPTAPAVHVATRDALIAASGDDVFVRCSVPLDEHVDAWAIGTGVAWYTASRRRRGAGWLTVVADPDVVPALVQVASEAVGSRLSGVTVPATALPHLGSLRPTDYNVWDWFVTSMQPPKQPGEEAVVWAGPDDLASIVELLDADSPRHSARPGDPDVLRWCVIRGDGGQLLACAALTEHVPGVAHLASIVTRRDQRGRGLGRAITAWLTRRLLDDGAPLVTLGMYADNDVAGRVYRDLGYVEAQHFASGYLPGRRAPGDADPVHDEAD